MPRDLHQIQESKNWYKNYGITCINIYDDGSVYVHGNWKDHVYLTKKEWYSPAYSNKMTIQEYGWGKSLGGAY